MTSGLQPPDVAIPGEFGPLPGPRMKAVYFAKALALGLILAALWVVEFHFPGNAAAIQNTIVIAALLVPTIAVLVWRGAPPAPLLAISFAADIAAITHGVHQGGGSDNTSGTLLYALLIVVAGLSFTRGAAYAVAAASSLAYAALTWAEVVGYLPHYSMYWKSSADIAGGAVMLTFALFGVAWLTSVAAVEIRHLFRDAEELRVETLGARAVTILFSDMEGFTPMTERLGDAAAHHLVARHHEIVRDQVARHDGTEVEVQGDGFVIAFPSADAAVACAVEMQRAFAEFSRAHPATPIRVRIGIHSGEALQAGTRFFGQTLFLATQVAGQAKGGEIAVSDRLREAVIRSPDVTFKDSPQARSVGTLNVHQVAWT